LHPTLCIFGSVMTTEAPAPAYLSCGCWLQHACASFFRSRHRGGNPCSPVPPYLSHPWNPTPPVWPKLLSRPRGLKHPTYLS
jgi:hypothetical protein